MRRGRASLIAKSKAATCQGVATAPDRGCSKWGQKDALVNPSFSAADAYLFSRTLSVGVTFPDAAGVDPDPFEGVLHGFLACVLDLDQPSFTNYLLPG